MNAREEILQRARRALADVTATDPEPDVPVVRPVPPPDPQVVDRFAEYVADYRAVVERTTPAGVAAAVAAALRTYEARRGRRSRGVPRGLGPRRR